jgi:hypothetical protein
MRKSYMVLMLMFASAVSSPSFDGRLVEYDVDGTAEYVNITWNTIQGATEQRQIRLPFHESFVAPMGMLAYMAAQKARVESAPNISGRTEILSNGVSGTVHVTLHINAQKLGEATSDAPYGIAKVSGKVE